jgi:hypothetical protein
MNWILDAYQKIRQKIIYRKKLKEYKKSDPYIYK